MVLLKAAVFDMDGTLLDTLDDICDSINDTLQSWSLPQKTNEELLQYIGWGARHLCKGATGFEDGEVLEEFHRQYRQRSLSREDPKTRPYDGIVEVVSELRRRGLKVFIYTNKPQAWTEKLAARYFAPNSFDAIYGVKEGGYLKPSPGGLFEMCESFSIDPKESAMIGDSPVDMETAQAAGAFGIAVTWGFRPRELLVAAGADAIVESSRDILKYF